MDIKYWKELFCIIVILDTFNCRKYDIEFESRKIYGQELSAVLERFRRTPDYTKILDDEIVKLRRTYDVNFLQNSFHYSKLLKDRVNEIISENCTVCKVLRQRTTAGANYTKYLGPHRKPIIRQHTHNMSGVERLEEYGRLDDWFPLQIKKQMVELGFEYCGLAIHGIIKSMSPAVNSMSTMQPIEKYTTHSSHKISPSQTIQTTDSNKHTNSDTYRNFKRKIKLI